MNRAEAIEFAREQQEIFGGRMGEFLEFVESELTQTNASNTLNALHDDTISRKAAIDEMRDMYHAAEKWGQEASDDVTKARAESCMASLVEMKLRVEKLPSAERRAADCWGCKCPKMERLTERRD